MFHRTFETGPKNTAISEDRTKWSKPFYPPFLQQVQHRSQH